MIIPRDKSPERDHDHERLQARSWLVESAAVEAETVLHGEFGHAWSQPTTAGSEAKPLPGADRVIDRTFLEVNVEAQSSRLASDLAVSQAQQRVAEVFDEFSA